MESDFDLFHSILKKHGLLEESKKEMVEQCQHKTIVDETCIDCNEYICHIFKNGAIKRKFGSNLQPDLANRGFCDQVIVYAQAYFHETQIGTTSFRGKMRTAIIAACVYHALLKIGKHASFNTVAKNFSLEKRLASKGFQRVKMCVPSTRNQFETPQGVATWIVEKLTEDVHMRTSVVSAVTNQFSGVHLAPACLRASVAAAVYLLVQHLHSSETVAEIADASRKKVYRLSLLFKKCN